MLQTLHLSAKIKVLAYQNSTKNTKTCEENLSNTNVCSMSLLKTVFFDFEALLGLFGAPLERFGVDLGLPGGSKKGSEIEKVPTACAILGLNGLWKASWDHFGWILEGLGP